MLNKGNKNSLQQRRRPPAGFKQALQGLAFWIGYKNELYNNHNLFEGAISNELISLLKAHLSKEYAISQEEFYRNLTKKKSKKFTNDRVDICIYKKDNKSIEKLDSIMEFKRYSPSDSNLIADLEYLSEFKRLNPYVRCFLVITSQSGFPKKLLNDNGNGKNWRKINYNKKLKKSHTKILEVYKAYVSKSLKRSPFVFLLEVFNNE